MDTILIEVRLPAANQTFDVSIPLQSQLHEVLPLIAALLGELSGGNYLPDADAMLCDSETGRICDINASMYELGLKNGSKLMLI